MIDTDNRCQGESVLCERTALAEDPYWFRKTFASAARYLRGGFGRAFARLRLHIMGFHLAGERR